jgi:phosphatidylglycerol---prolipoprotein diacylglyceryl transferase
MAYESPLGLINCAPYEGQNSWGKALILELPLYATEAIRWVDLGLKPVAFSIGGWIDIRWYSLAYIFGIMLGWYSLTKILSQPGAPLAKRHADDLILYATLGIILGGRLGYALFYKRDMFLHPMELLKLWEGGMSFHGGVLGVMASLFYLVRKEKLDWLRTHDYIAVCVPPGMFLGRLANFVNGELWGRPTTSSWGIIFDGPQDDLPRHASQLYEAGLEGLVLGIIMWALYWKTDARYYPGRMVGVFALFMGIFRFIVEYFREPDVGVTGLFGMSMGQTLCVPLIAVGVYLLATAKGRRKRVESIAGVASVG